MKYEIGKVYNFYLREDVSKSYKKSWVNCFGERGFYPFRCVHFYEARGDYEFVTSFYSPGNANNISWALSTIKNYVTLREPKYQPLDYYLGE